jgi:hypothetical protein
MDCFEEPVIGARVRATRWLAMTLRWQVLNRTIGGVAIE